MKLHANVPGQFLNTFTGYGPNFVDINQQRREGSLLVTATQVEAWRPGSFDELDEADFAALLAYTPEIVLLGTGGRLRFPHPSLTRRLAAAQVGVDAMDVSALCRTFNILVAEDRRVVAAVLFD